MTKRKSPAADPWKTKPEIIRRFLDLLSKYEALGQEVKYIIGKRIKDSKIEISAVTSRAKTLNSFLDKLDRKSYEDPFSDITDFAGVRVVCLYLDDINNIEAIIRKEFEVVEKVDKLSEKEPDRFGYDATHFIVRLGNRSFGARYDDLKTLMCEIQVRTVLQDAWAIIDHHLVYKNEAAVPRQLQRKLNSLSGLFETADDQFRQIRMERLKYVDTVRESTKEPVRFLATELNLDSFREYLQWRFPSTESESFEGQIGKFLELIQGGDYKILADIERDLDEDAIEQARAALEDMEGVARCDDGTIPSSTLATISLAIVNPEVFNTISMFSGITESVGKRRRKQFPRERQKSQKPKSEMPNRAIGNDEE